ncbi:F-box domain-containing protein [Favolaschia claudopus]|uniref:F-box domain-containing protein n=1 Tax=Favolaschia claudopus TaxID=2862362 RepID=A0AAW0BFX5_9AGAR
MAAVTGMTSPIPASREICQNTDQGTFAIEDPSPGTRHHTLLSSNDSPTDSDIELIRSVLAESDRRLQSVHEEIQNLKLQPQAESADSARILQRLEEALVWDAGKFDLEASPWLLTHVCGLWRAVSLSMPLLWSQIAIDYVDSEPPIRYSLRLAETQLRRAGPLKVHFYSSETMDAGPQLEMFNLLASQCSRWEELSIGLTSIITPSLLLPLRDRLPSLRRVALQISHSLSASTELQCLDCFDSAPSLVDFDCFHERSFLPITLPVGLFVRYGLNAPWERHLQILNQASNLVEARIQIAFQGDADWPDLPAHAVNLVHLRRLFVSHAFALCYLRAPNLEQLALVDRSDSMKSLNSYFRPFVSRSSCQIRRLILGSPSAKTLVEILIHTSHITELVIMEDEDSDTYDVFETLEASGYIIAPQLTLIFLACTDLFRIHYTPFLKMLESRWRAEVCPLQHAALLVDGGHKPSSSTLDGLMKLRQDGLDLKMIVDDDDAALLAMKGWDFQNTWN